MKLFLVLFLSAINMTASATEMIFYKVSDPRIALSITENSAKIYSRQYYIDGVVGETSTEMDEQYLFYSGELKENLQTGVLRIALEEGDVCPDLEIDLFHDIEKGEKQGAVVTTVVGELGSASRNCSINVIVGEYLREK